MSRLKFLIRQYYRIQEHRVAFGNQERSMAEQGGDTALFIEYHDRLKSIEKSIKDDIEDIVTETELWKKFLKDVRGIGPTLAAGLYAYIDIEKAKHVSSIWKYAGLAPDSKRKKGEKLDYNPELKDICWKIGESFLKSKSKYKLVYDERKEYEKENSPDLTDGHQHNRAKRYAVKEFLKDLYKVWREIEDLEVTPPYAVAELDHADKDKPENQS